MQKSYFVLRYIKKKLNMKTKKVLLAVIGTILLFVGCDSDDGVACIDDFDGGLVESEEKLTGVWVLSSIISEKEVDLTDDEEDNPSNDIYTQYSECKNDRVYTFGANRRYAFERGEKAKVCQDKSTSEGTWQLTGDTLAFVTGCNLFQLSIDFNEEESQFSLTDDYQIREFDGNTITAEVIFTYSLSED